MSTLQNELRRLTFNEPDPTPAPPREPELPPPPRSGRWTREYTDDEALTVYRAGDRAALRKLRESIVDALRHIGMQLEQSRLSREESKAWLIEQGYSAADAETETADWSEANWRRRAKLIVFYLNKWTAAIKRRMTEVPNVDGIQGNADTVFQNAGRDANAVLDALRGLRKEGHEIVTYAVIGDDLIVTHYRR